MLRRRTGRPGVSAQTSPRESASCNRIRRKTAGPSSASPQLVWRNHRVRAQMPLRRAALPSPSALSLPAPPQAASAPFPPACPSAGLTPIFPVVPAHEVPRPEGRGPRTRGERGEGAKRLRREWGTGSGRLWRAAGWEGGRGGAGTWGAGSWGGADSPPGNSHRGA